MTGPLILLTGGARSGKSELALQLAARQSAPVVFLATAQAGDEEMAARIAVHRSERPEAWTTIEEPLALREAVQGVEVGVCLIVDCLTLWTANALEAHGSVAVEAEARAAAELAAARPGMTIAVTNEVGLGIVPDNVLARSYRDLLGRVNAIWAAHADEAYLLVAGRAVALGRATAVVEGLR